jgi:hypothetical protein
MSANVCKIERALGELGLVPLDIKWMPWEKAMEMGGIGGGWRVEAIDPLVHERHEYRVFWELSIDELLREIYRYPGRMARDEYPDDWYWEYTF